MKFRIVQFENGKYQVQRYAGFFIWEHIYTYLEDYPSWTANNESWWDSEERKDKFSNVFSSLELAEKKLQEEIAYVNEKLESERLKKLNKKLTVIKKVKI